MNVPKRANKKVAPDLEKDRSGAIYFSSQNDADRAERNLQWLFRRSKHPKIDRDGGTEWFYDECFEEFMSYVREHATLMGYTAIKYGLDVFPEPRPGEKRARSAEEKRISEQRRAKQQEREREIEQESWRSNRDRFIELFRHVQSVAQPVMGVGGAGTLFLTFDSIGPGRNGLEKALLEMMHVSFCGTSVLGCCDWIAPRHEGAAYIFACEIPKRVFVLDHALSIEELIAPIRQEYSAVPRATNEQNEVLRMQGY